ncbi:DUF2171 domain-containing protein [Teichococcus aestuarii]|uniref:DUF2171 domain-containing protein n=1 Tax=Teichococcus aestuarii TaxID=568898 RepID=A0A2U1UYH3_9PROT|nr:DUF2171 domain-containing protein [Pseudoroseomonas aestuarii]PWC26709.1 hypothetical protein CR165_21740 [Pseudoroseomonas aestuarii]
MVNAAKIEQGEVQDHMPVVGSDGQAFGVVDRVEGDYIKLARNDPTAGGRHRYLPRSTVAGLEGGVVRLSMPAAQAADACVDEAEMAQRLSLDPDAAAQLGRPTDDAPHGSRGHAHGGPKGQSPGDIERRRPGATDAAPERTTHNTIENQRGR